jgi:predicted RNA-binding protein with PIN domain
MQFLIDGHNLIGQMHDIRLDDPNDEAKLAARLKSFCMRNGHHCTLLFDNGLPGGLSRLSNSLVRVIFAPPRTPADKLIIDRMRALSDVRAMVVVSSDRAIRAVAEQRGIRVIGSADFASALNAPARRTVKKDEDANPVVTAAEVDYWLKIFGDSSGSHS